MLILTANLVSGKLVFTVCFRHSSQQITWKRFLVASVISKHINKKKLEHRWINLAEEIKDNMVSQQLTGSPVLGADKGDVSFQRLSGLQPLLKNEANSFIFC